MASLPAHHRRYFSRFYNKQPYLDAQFFSFF